MPRLVNVQSGAVVSVSDETAALLGSEWQPEKTKASAKKSTSSKPSK